MRIISSVCRSKDTLFATQIGWRITLILVVLSLVSGIRGYGQKGI